MRRYMYAWRTYFLSFVQIQLDLGKMKQALDDESGKFTSVKKLTSGRHFTFYKQLLLVWGGLYSVTPGNLKFKAHYPTAGL